MNLPRRPPAHESPQRPTRRPPRGFSLIEVMVVLVVGGVILAFAGLYMSGYLRRIAPQRAAQVFVQDLKLARSTALRTRSPVVIKFSESSRWYAISIRNTGTEVARRRFAANAEIDLSAVDLRMPGDSVTFDRWGIASLAGSLNPKGLGEARFTHGATLFNVYFNAMGAARVAEN